MNRAAKTSAGRLWDAILVTDDGFGARMGKKCAQSHRFGLGSGWVGGIPLGGGGGGGRRTENRDHIYPKLLRPLCYQAVVPGHLTSSRRSVH